MSSKKKFEEKIEIRSDEVIKETTVKEVSEAEEIESSAEKKKDTKSRIAKKRKKSRLRLIIVLIVLLAIIGIGGYFVYRYLKGDEGAQVKNIEAEVTRATIVNVIEGSGTIEANAQYEVKYLNSVDVLADFFEEGDYVEKDQILYQMDSEDIQRNITKQQRNVEKARMNYDELVEKQEDCKIKTDIDGVITNLYVSEGDNVSNGGKIADIVDKNTLVISVPFGVDDAKNIYNGQSAEINLVSSGSVLYGYVTNVGTGSYINGYNVEVTNVEIQATNPGGVSEGTVATAVIGEYACYDTAAFEYKNSKTITAKSSGEVEIINYKKGDAVANGNIIVQLKSENTEKSIREAKISLEDAQSSLEQLMETKDDATIRSKISGKVIEKNIKAGEILDSQTSSTMALIADLSSLKFNMSIDELDISKISVGQEVTITADALSGRRFNGTVTSVGFSGTAFQGVTSYPVTVTIDNSDESSLIPGMNVEAQIIIDTAENVLRIPVAAVRMGGFVIVKDDGTFADPLEMKMSVQNLTSAAGERSKGDIIGNTEASETQSKTNSSPEEKQGDMPQGQRGKMPQGKRAGSQQGNYDQGSKSEFIANETVTDSKEGNADLPQESLREEKGNFNTEEMEKKNKERMKSIIDKLDVPEGYTVVRVQTGLNDGTYVEIKEIKGSLKEGDKVLIPVVVNNNPQGTQNSSGASGGFGGGMPGGFGGGMPGGFSSNRSGGLSGNRSSGFGGTRSGSGR